MQDILIWCTGAFFFLLLLAPVGTYLVFGWPVRKDEILNGLNSEERSALGLYFTTFQPNFRNDIPDLEQRLKLYFDRQFGRRHFVIPLLLLCVISGTMLMYVAQWVREIMSATPSGDQNFGIAIYAVMGAYMWVLYDQITRWWYSDISPGDLYWAGFRFAIAIPMGYAVSEMFTRQVGPAIAFVLGAFPTAGLLSLLRKVGRIKLNLGEEGGQKESELQSLQGIDARIAERFTAQGISTIAQLAEADPIRLTILTNLGFSFVVDCVSQSLLWIYLKDDLDACRKSGIRGAFEVVNLWVRLRNADPEAVQVVTELATRINIQVGSVRNVLREVVSDPYAGFVYASLSQKAVILP